MKSGANLVSQTGELWNPLKFMLLYTILRIEFYLFGLLTARVVKYNI